MKYILRRPRAFWISLCNLVGLVCSMAGVLLLFLYALPLAPPGGQAVFTVPPGREVEVLQGWDAQIQHYHTLAYIGLALVLIGTLLEAVPPFCTAIGSWRRRPIVPQEQTREETEPQPRNDYDNSAAQAVHQMSTPPQTGIHVTPIGTRTVDVLHDFVRDAVSHLSNPPNDFAPEFEDVIRLVRGADGNFRGQKKHIPRLRPLLSDELLSALPNYQSCLEYLRSDAVVGPHLDRLVGDTITGSIRLYARNILARLIFAMFDEEGHLTFTSQKFYTKWQELTDFFGNDRIACKTIVAFPHLEVPTFPLRLNEELVLDRLTEDEVNRCYQVGVLRPDFFSGFPIVFREFAVGLRRTAFVPKLIRQGDEPLEPPKAGDEGSFGKRPPSRGDLTIDDVLSALRLFKRTQIRAAGVVIWADSPVLSGTHYEVLGRWPYGGRFELSEAEVPQLLELWHLLEEGGAARFDFDIRRFNLAFDRRRLDDRIVDLVIGAEALFLGELDEQYRGELRFRFALRAAKFIEHPSYSEREVFGVMLRAYDARSAIVHGGSPKYTHLPDNQSADLLTFTDAIEDLVRLGLRKALSMKQDGKKIRQSEYWNTLVFSNTSPAIEPSHSP